MGGFLIALNPFSAIIKNIIALVKIFIQINLEIKKIVIYLQTNIN